MNIAILFDSAEEETKIDHPKLHGQEIYLYALKAFYLHWDIDHIIYFCAYADTLPDVQDYISAWRRESGIEKPVTVLRGIRHFAQLWLYILQGGQERPGKYVIHDVRFPFVTEGMITKILQMADEHDIAMFSENMEDESFRICDGKIEMLHNPKRLQYPVAVRADSRALHCLDEPRLVLQDLAYCEPWICEDIGEVKKEVAGAWTFTANLIPV